MPAVFPYANRNNSAVPGSTICIGGNTQLTATGANSYVWSPPTGLSCTNCPNPVANPVQTTSYTVTGTAANGCTNNTLVTIVVEPVPVSVVSESATSVCTGQSIVFDGSLSTDVTTFSWAFTGGTPATSNASVPVITYNTVGTYVATLTSTNNCGSDNLYTKTINVIQSPTVTVSQAIDTVCAGTGVGASITAGGATTYSWSPAAGLNVTNAATVIANPTQTTTYTVIGSSANGCSDSMNVTIVVDPCLGIDHLLNSDNVSNVYNSGTKQLEVLIANNLNANRQTTINIVNSIGQVISANPVTLSAGENKVSIDMSQQADGIYYIRIAGENKAYAAKFMKN